MAAYLEGMNNQDDQTLSMVNGFGSTGPTYSLPSNTTITASQYPTGQKPLSTPTANQYDKPNFDWFTPQSSEQPQAGLPIMKPQSMGMSPKETTHQVLFGGPQLGTHSNLLKTLRSTGNSNTVYK